MNIYYLHNKHRWFNSGILWAAKFGWSHMVSWVTSAQNSLRWRQESQWCVRLLCLQMRMGGMKTEWLEVSPSTQGWSLIKGFTSGSAVTANWHLASLFWREWTGKPGSLLGGQVTRMCIKAKRFYSFSLCYLIVDDRCKGGDVKKYAVFKRMSCISMISEWFPGGTSSWQATDLSKNFWLLWSSQRLVTQFLNMVDALQPCRLWGSELCLFSFFIWLDEVIHLFPSQAGLD